MYLRSLPKSLDTTDTHYAEHKKAEEGLQFHARPRLRRRRGRRDGRPREALRPHVVPLRGSEIGGDGGAARRLRRLRVDADRLREVAGVPVAGGDELEEGDRGGVAAARAHQRPDGSAAGLINIL